MPALPQVHSCNLSFTQHYEGVRDTMETNTDIQTTNLFLDHQFIPCCQRTVKNSSCWITVPVSVKIMRMVTATRSPGQTGHPRQLPTVSDARKCHILGACFSGLYHPLPALHLHQSSKPTSHSNTAPAYKYWRFVTQRQSDQADFQAASNTNRCVIYLYEQSKFYIMQKVPLGKKKAVKEETVVPANMFCYSRWHSTAGTDI